MKNLFLLIAFLALSVSFAQSPDGMVKIDMLDQTELAYQDTDHSRLDSFNSKSVNSEPDIDTLIVSFQILNITGDTAQIMTSYGNYKYSISVRPELNPFGYTLQVDREYTIALERDMNLVRKFQTRGQTRTLPAKMIWFTVSENQLKKDQVQLTKFIKSVPGYDRSPRNGH